jgi:protein involved in polysaccharide export with SLBB domain
MNTYDKLKADQQANEVVKKGLESEKDPDDGPVRLLIDPGDMAKYYREKMKVIQKDLSQLSRLLLSTDSIPPLQYFGYSFFSLRDSIQFIDNANVSANYILGYGDEIIISVWGQAEQHERAMLERDGTVFIKNVGLLYLGGKTASEAKTYINKRFGKVYASLNSNPPLTYLEFSIGKVKNINITVAGHVQFPGNYVVNPSMSIPNILVLAGGVTETGTLRNIMVQRDGSIVDSMDLYPLMTGNGLSKSLRILDSDVIVVPPRGETVAVTGAVLIPAYFETTDKNNINSVLQYAGGISRNGSNQVIIARYGAPNIYVSKNQFDSTPVMNGDSLIFPKRSMQVKSISISVNNRPLTKIPWIEGLSFDIILKIVHVDPNNIKDVELVRRSSKDGTQRTQPFNFPQNDNFKFLPSDHLSVHLYEKFTPTKMVVVKGDVNSPGVYPLINNRETLNSILSRSGGLQTSSDINNVIVKRDTLIFGSKTGDLILTPGDTVIAKPIVGTVKVEGEVHNPGNMAWSANNSAKDYLSFAGGLTTYGDKKHIVYITPYGEASRINTRSNVSILPGSIIRVSEKPLSEQNVKPDRFQQISSLVTTLVTIAILANTTK